MTRVAQENLFDDPGRPSRGLLPPKGQFLKWVGNKQRSAAEIASFLPPKFDRYYEPFLGSGAVLGTLAPRDGVGSDALKPLIEIWQQLREDADVVLEWYRERWQQFQEDRQSAYEAIRERFNSAPNAPDLLFLARTCYGGVIRFRRDGYMSTPLGPHAPISPATFAKRVGAWRQRVKGTQFIWCDFEETIDAASAGDLIYCDPPYYDTQRILYGAQDFSLERMFAAIDRAVVRGARVALSIDGTKKSGRTVCDVPIPEGLFKRSVSIHKGGSMLKRFQVRGRDVARESVSDLLMLTF